jgi:hypothetical protein
VRCDGPRCALDTWAPDQSRGARVRPPQRSAAQAAWLRRRTLGVARLPRRIIEPAVIDGLSADAPELVLATLLQEYRDWCEAGLQGTSLARIRFLLHLTTLQRHRDKADAAAGSDAAAALLAQGPPDLEPSDSEEDQDALLEAIQSEEDDIVESATGAAARSLGQLGQCGCLTAFAPPALITGEA